MEEEYSNHLLDNLQSIVSILSLENSNEAEYFKLFLQITQPLVTKSHLYFQEWPNLILNERFLSYLVDVLTSTWDIPNYNGYLHRNASQIWYNILLYKNIYNENEILLQNFIFTNRSRLLNGLFITSLRLKDFYGFSLQVLNMLASYLPNSYENIINIGNSFSFS